MIARTKIILGMNLAGIALAASLASAAEPDLTKLPAAAAKAGVTYDKDIKPLVEASCLKCHSGDRPKSKYSMESVENIIKGGSSKEAAVVAGKSDKSPLVWYIAELIEELEMPPLDKRDTYPALTKDQIGLVRAWIDQGAK